MACMQKFCDFFVVVVCFGLVAPSYGITGFRNGNSADLRRQISFAQQGHILSDVQQHHRFSVSPGQLPDLRQAAQNNFVQAPNIHLNQPLQFNQNQQLFVQPPPFQPLPDVVPQPQGFFDQGIITNNQAFLPLNPAPQPQQLLQFAQQPQTFFQQAHQHSGQQPVQLQQAPPNQVIAPQPPTQHSFLPTIPTQPSRQENSFKFDNGQGTQKNFPQVSPDTQRPPGVRHGQIPFQQSLGTNPLFSSGQSSQLQSLFEEQRKQDLERLKELQERQKIIQKHKQFLERQQQKQQQKVQKLHEDFSTKQKKKQEEIVATARPETDFTLNTQARPRGILPHEVSLFQKALDQYDALHPTTTPLTTTTKKSVTTPKAATKNRSRQRAKSRSEAAGDSSEQFLQQNRQKIYKELKTILQDKTEGDENQDPNRPVLPNKLQYFQRQDLLKQLKLAIAENTQELNGKNFTSREISLPNGQKFEVIRTSDPNLIAGATPLSADSSMLSQIVSASPNQIRPAKPPKVSFDDLTKDVIPPGADYEVIKQGGNGKLEEVTNLPNQKKVTFVFIEEQNDGSYKVKGVKGPNGEENKDVAGQNVDSILKKINDGEISLPPSVSKRPKVTTTTRSPYSSTTRRDNRFSSRPSSTHAQASTSTKLDTTYVDFEPTKLNTPVTSSPKYYDSPSPSSLSINHNGSPSPTTAAYEVTTPSSSIYKTSLAGTTVERNSPSSVFYTKSPSTTINGHQMYSSSTSNTQYGKTSQPTHSISDQTIEFSQTPSLTSPTSPTYSTDTISIIPSSSTYYPNPTNVVARSTTPRTVAETAGTQLTYSTQSHGLVEILKENGLFATAKYLKQSGLDSILNETGPYTVFAPTDKAFRTLLIQLGGPDKAEEKFKENPRLLSGLLLHHVIPGAFEISALQDEMTGVSLAGTQLRVNQYAMHDVEWNEIKVTTVNGARVLTEKQDIIIPQGVAHAVDRVMFPLPVGDIVQTLQADRERRFTNFLKALFSSGLSETLSDTKTFTVFAPTDRAFSALKTEELQQLVTDKENARELVMRHIAPGTLFSAGMRYYQVRDSMETGKPITLQKNAGRIKVNSGHVITHNIPTTNGVIHAVDSLL